MNIKEESVFNQQAEKINKIFYDFMQEKGFKVHNYNAFFNGHGARAYSNSDSFVPVFELSMISYPEKYTIRIIDRNGNGVLHGNEAGSYVLKIANVDVKEEKILDNFKSLLENAYERYGKHSRNNRLDFAFLNLEYGYEEIYLK